MAFGFKFCNTKDFAESARRYNPKLFNALQSRASNITLLPTPKFQIEQFACNLEQIFGEVEGAREPMRTNSTHVSALAMEDSSAA